jgi:hypothetical protein
MPLVHLRVLLAAGGGSHTQSTMERTAHLDSRLGTMESNPAGCTPSAVWHREQLRRFEAADVMTEQRLTRFVHRKRRARRRRRRPRRRKKKRKRSLWILRIHLRRVSETFLSYSIRRYITIFGSKGWRDMLRGNHEEGLDCMRKRRQLLERGFGY